jgi:hypothetical protein
LVSNFWAAFTTILYKWAQYTIVIITPTIKQVTLNKFK